MRLVLISPYTTPARQGHPAEIEIVENMRKKGQLKGVEIDMDDGYPTEWNSSARDAEFLAYITIGAIKKVREYSEMGKHDAIVYSSGVDAGFAAARAVSKIPVAGAQHSAVHVASLIGERAGIIVALEAGGLMRRQNLETYHMSHKVASYRAAGHAPTYLMEFIRKYKKEERVKLPEIKKVIDDAAAQCIAAIEEDRVDTLILGGPPLQTYEDEIRRKLDDAGYGEIQLISEIPAAVEMARAMVDLKLMAAPRAYPTNALKVKPKFR